MVRTNASTSWKLDIGFFGKQKGATTILTTDSYIEHVSIAAAATDYIKGGWAAGGATWTSTKLQRSCLTGLAIPYRDADLTQKFHIGIWNNSATAVTSGCLQIEIGWRQKSGGD